MDLESKQKLHTPHTNNRLKQTTAEWADKNNRDNTLSEYS